MQTYWIEELNGEFTIRDSPRPTLKMNEVLIKVHAGGVNPLDTKIRAGQAPHAKQPLPAVLGLDSAGTVEEVGPGVTAFNPGDEVYGMVGGTTLDASFASAKRYTGHVVSCLGWGSHSFAPLSFRGASYSGVFSLLPLLTGENRAHHGRILARAAGLAEDGKLGPLLNEQRFSDKNIGGAHALVAAGTLGKVVVEF